MKEKNPNAKNKDWKTPVDLPSVKPEDYPSTVASAHGSAFAYARKTRPDGGPPDYTLPGYPSSKDTAQKESS